MKTCFKCNELKPLSEFYKHSTMADGHINKCKECAKFDSNKHRSENLEKVREYDRFRDKFVHRVKQRSEVNRLWRAEDKRRQSAHNAVKRAMVSGKLVRMPCERCGNQKSLAHHEDYDKKLDVMWLCQPCHKQRHKELRLMIT